jgi:hypothetical protein
MRITSAGDIGVGTTAPANKFEVFGNGVRNVARASTTAGTVLVEAQASDYWTTPTYTGTSLTQSGSTATGTTFGISNVGLGVLSFQNTTTALIGANNAVPIVFATNSAERMRIDSSGNVGIGTSSPSFPLDVAGNIRSNSWIGRTNISAPTADAAIYRAADNTLAFSTLSTERMRIDSSGIITASAGNLMLVSGTRVASTSGTSIDFTSLPSWVKRITVTLQGISGNNSSDPLIRLGTSGGFVTSGYLGAATAMSSSLGTTNYTNGFGIYQSGQAGAGVIIHGTMIISSVGSNGWVASGTFARSDGSNTSIMGGSIALGAALTQVRVTFANGTDTFDAGAINILYE